MIYESDRNMPLGFKTYPPAWVTALPAQEKACHAIQMRDVMMLRDALAEGADLHDPEQPLLPEAAQRQHIILCEYLLARGAKADFPNSLGQTAAYYAAQSGERQLLELLSANGADLFRGDQMKTTPLMTAVFYGHLNCIEFLVARGANVNDRDEDGLSVLGYARHGRFAMLGERRRSIRDSRNFFENGMADKEEQYAEIRSFLRRKGAIDCKTPAPRLTFPKQEKRDELRSRFD